MDAHKKMKFFWRSRKSEGFSCPSKEKTINKEDRDWYVEFWANYVRTHRDSEWGRQQNVFINSLMQSTRQTKISAEDYLKIKGENNVKK